jgi:hypothetical protein
MAVTKEKYVARSKYVLSIQIQILVLVLCPTTMIQRKMGGALVGCWIDVLSPKLMKTTLVLSATSQIEI